MGLIGENIGGCRGTFASPRRQKWGGAQLGLHETGSELYRIALWDCFGTLSLLLLAIRDL